jgi:hypothetical protein
MKRIVTVTVERVRRIIVRQSRSPGPGSAPPRSTPADDKKKKEKSMNKKLLAAFVFAALVAVPARTQGPPVAAGLQLPSKIVFTPYGNLLVAESGTPAPNTGRISIIDRTGAGRRTLIDGLPSGLSQNGEEAAPSGPSGLAVQATTVYVTIGAGDGVLPGPAPGTERVNDTPSSPILSSLLVLHSSVPLDIADGGFSLTPADHAELKNGGTITRTNAQGESMTVRLVVDFPNSTPNPRPDFAANVRASNPFGVVAHGQTVYVVDASQNLIRRVDANSGATTTLTTFGAVQNTLPFGPPFTDPVPDSIHMRGDDLIVTYLTGFPFPPAKAEIRKVNILTGASETLVGGLTSAIDAHPLGGGAGDPLLALEFSTNMNEGTPGRLRLVAPGAEPVTLAEGLPTPTSMAVDAASGEVFITHIFPGLITRVNVTGRIPAAAPAAVIPVVASVPGAFGAHYTTSMQISNPHPFPIAGRIVVHPQGRQAAPADPALAYTLAPFATRVYADFMSAAGATGSGSADVIATVGAAPANVTRIIDDAATGMPAVQIPQIDPADALTAGTSGALATPSDTRYRMNIGIRTLGAGASLTLRAYDAAGMEYASVTRPFPPNYFQQFSAAGLLGHAVTNGGAVMVSVTSGSAIVYASTVSNETGDATLQVASPVM